VAESLPRSDLRGVHPDDAHQHRSPGAEHERLSCFLVASSEQLQRSWAESSLATNDIDVISPYDGPMIVASSPQRDGKEPLGELSARDAEILTFERQWWKFAGAKEQAIRDKFQMSATRYYQVLNALIDKPEALAQDPLLVKRLRRLRATRQRNRSAKRLGIDLTIE
jgi:hypothetical protein